MIKETWYLLYDGQSTDGTAGFNNPKFIGRTTDIDVAKRHYRKVSSSPYSTGRVEIVTDDEHVHADQRSF